MSQYVKPQSPIRIEDTYIYPLTTADQVMLENGERLNSKIYNCVGLDTEDGVIGEPNPVNADTLGGKQASEYATNDYVNQQVKNAAPYNYAHNSDFTQWVAKKGLGGLHGDQAYAGDRWILVSGTVSGDVRSDGNGYQNIKLNGTIKQKVANAPDGGKVAIEMISGTADISYNNGEIIITSSGGIIKNVLLCVAEILPEYQPKGYGMELDDCNWYYYKSGIYTMGYTIQSSVANGTIRVIFPMSVTMREVPNVVYNSANTNSKILAGGTSYDITSISATNKDGQLRLILTFDGTIPAHTPVYVMLISLELIADL